MICRKLSVFCLRSSQRCFHFTPALSWTLKLDAHLDIDYLCSPQNFQEIATNIAIRKGVGNIKLVHELGEKLKSINEQQGLETKKQFYDELFKIPNKTHPEVATYKEPKVVKEFGNKRTDANLLDFQEIAKKLKLVRTDQLGNLSGNKSYYLLGEMAELEHAIIRYVVSKLLKHNFQLISVPDILHRDIIEGCGMDTKGTRTQVYCLDPTLHNPDLCLSGTSEMALAGFLSNKKLKLPLKLAAVSRCYRAETSNLMEERGIYRVHEFSKVEMFVVTKGEESESMLGEIREVQEEIFGSFGIHLKVLDMPPDELGAQAYRKYDLEAWMPGRGLFGEVSSCSNCLDYQARRLGIRDEDGSFAHTLNGTACAIPRLLIALVENFQNKNGTISVPEVLTEYLGGKKFIGKQKGVPELKLIKGKK